MLAEALRSPDLLSDLAGLEQYIAESYNSRSFIELLQNADDASATKLVVRRHDRLLFVANDGRLFSEADLESLCRSASSRKDRATSIGFRGIGFKSVLGFARTVHLFSGALSLTFSRARTAHEVPQAARVPLIRIPHPVLESENCRMAPVVHDLLKKGLGTVFVFDDLIADSVEAEFSTFDPTSMLFLRYVQGVELGGTTNEAITAARETLDAQTTRIHLSSSRGTNVWSIMQRNGVSLAFRGDENGIQCLDEREAVAHAFLPTHEPTGFPFKTNGDISTDPSRTRAILDSRTKAFCAKAALLVADTLESALACTFQRDGAGRLSALVPFADPRIAALQGRGFKALLIAAIRDAAGQRFANLRMRPDWLNAVDFEAVAAAARIRAVPRQGASLLGLSAFLKFLGAKEATHGELVHAYGSTRFSRQGAAEIVAFLVRSHAMKQLAASDIDPAWRLWPVGGRVLSLTEARDATQTLDTQFVDAVKEKVGITTELSRFLSAIVGPQIAAKLLPAPDVSATVKEQGVTAPQGTWMGSMRSTAPLVFKRWRRAEEQLAELLRARGWEVEDVSRQNIGYDLRARKPGGPEMCVEVKLIAYPGQPFVLTSNEEAVAREKGDAYLLALVRPTDDFLEVAFIQNPIGKVQLTRQCRQWVWECASYEFAPERFSFAQ